MGDSMAEDSICRKKEEATDRTFYRCYYTSISKPKKQYVTRFDAWNFFTKSKDNPEKVRCNCCPSVLKYKSKSQFDFY